MNALEDLTSKTMNFISDIQKKIDGNTYDLDELYDAMHLINWAYNFGNGAKELNLSSEQRENIQEIRDNILTILYD